MVTKASKDSAHVARSRSVDENKKLLDRSMISSDDLQELLRVCADMPDRLAATRATALIKVSLLTGESTKLHSWRCLKTLFACALPVSEVDFAARRKFEPYNVIQLQKALQCIALRPTPRFVV